MGDVGKAFSSIGSAIGGVVQGAVKGIESGIVNVAKAVAPSVVDALDSVANGAISSLGGALSSVAGNIPGIGSLLQNLIGKGQQGLTSLADGGISSLVNGATSALGNLFNVGNQQVGLPSLTQRTGSVASSQTDLASQLAQLLQQLGIKLPTATTTSGAAATAAPAAAAPAATTTAAAATAASTGVGGGTSPTQALLNAMPTGMPPIPANLDNPQVAAKFQQDMANYTSMCNLISTCLKDMSDVEKNTIRNTAV